MGANEEGFTIALGSLPFGGVVDDENATNIINLALERGCNTFDVAPLYGGGNAPRILGKALRYGRETVKIWCSIGLTSRPDINGVFAVDVAEHSPLFLESSVDQMLYELERDHIDVLNLHAFDPVTPVDEVLATISKLLSKGKILSASYSNLNHIEFDQLLLYDSDEKVIVQSLQMHGNILERRLVQEFTPKIDFPRRGIICYRPLARGLLGREYGPENARPSDSRSSRGWRLDRYLEPSTLKAISDLRNYVESAGFNLPTIALRWLESQEAVTGAVVGVRTSEQLTEILDGYSAFDSPEFLEDMESELVNLGLGDIAKSFPLDYFEK